MSVRDSPESVVVTATVRLVAPFVFAFALYTTFHGATGAGGGFQGGVLIAAVVVAFAFAFGVDQVTAWVDRRLLAAGAVAGVVTFAAVGAGAVLAGGAFLGVTAFPGAKGALYAVEVVEVGIAVTVAATVVALFLALATAEVGGE